MTSPNARTTDELHRRATVVDLHAHPATKTYFGDSKLGGTYTPDPGFNLTELRTSYRSLVAGGVDVLCSSIIVPEHDLRKDCWVIEVASIAIPKLREALTSPADEIAEKMIHHVEDEVADVMAGNPSKPIEVVKSYAALEQAVTDGKIAVVHTIEGGHPLMSDPANVSRFKNLGVASITLAHFYPNGIAPPVEGIPKDVVLRLVGCFRFKEDLTLGLTQTGKDVVEEMYEKGVVVDLTHCTPPARADVYAIPNPRRRPITMTHVGVWAARPEPMNPKDDEIRTIAETGGVIGVIFYDYWLTIQKHPGSDRLKHIIPTVAHLVQVGGEDCVAFGSDFDGMTDPPDDLKEPADWPNLTAALVAEGFSDAQIGKFLGGNATRVLKEGWG